MKTIPDTPKATRRRSAESRATFRYAIVQRAKEIYRTQGYSTLTVRLLTQELGVSPMAFYSYFPSKQALIREIWVDIFQELLHALLAAGRESGSPSQTLRTHVHAYIDYFEGHVDHYRIIYGTEWKSGVDEPDVTTDPVYTRMMDLFRERVVACAVGGSVPEADARNIAGVVKIKLLGFLQARLGTLRNHFAANPTIKQMYAEDIVRSVECAVFDAVNKKEKS